VEKSLKAILQEKGVRPPKTHDILRLYGLVSEATGLELDLRMLQVLNDLYVDARYPGEFGLLPYGRPSSDDARQFYEFAAEVYRKAWELVTGDYRRILPDRGQRRRHTPRVLRRKSILG
jgi:HEPN domain-containing protein